MADEKISALTAIGTVAAADLFVVVDVDDTTQAPTGTTKKATALQIYDPLLGAANAWTAANTFTITDAGTTNTVSPVVLAHDSSGTPAVGFGVFAPIKLKSSTTSGQDASMVVTSWATATHASRKARVTHYVYDTSAREAFREEASGSAAMVGFLGANASAQLVSPDLGTMATTFGFASGTPTFGKANLTGQFAAGQFRGYIDGLITSRASTTTVTVAAGVVRDTTDAAMIYLSAATTKTLQSSGAWAAGTGNNGLDTGARANSTWYHVFAISKLAGANPDVLFSTSATAPTMPSTYVLFQRIGSIKTDGSGNIILWTQKGDQFLWDVPVNDVNVTNPGTSAATRTLTVPTGYKVDAIINVGVTGATAVDMPAGIYISELSATDSVPSAIIYNPLYIYTAATSHQEMVSGTCWTNTSAQVRSRLQISAASTNFYISTRGWIDPRGKNT